jgi:flavin-dependent dehydrogenase
VLVAGAGPAGATLARLLAVRGIGVVLVDPGRSMVDRLEMIGPAALPVLGAIGADCLLNDPAVAAPCLGISRRWGLAGTQSEDFLRYPGGRGFVVARIALDRALRAMAVAAGAVAVRGRLCGLTRSQGRTFCRIATERDTRMIPAAICIDATGRRAALARWTGARHVLHEPLVARLQAAGTDGETDPWLRVDDGHDHWRYSLAGPGNRRETWCVFRQVFRRRAKQCGGSSVNASASCLDTAAGDGWIAVGDAACAFDPIASQGLYHAMSTALVAAGLILSTGGLTAESGACYAQAVRATFAYSERRRVQIYRALSAKDDPHCPGSHEPASDTATDLVETTGKFPAAAGL